MPPSATPCHRSLAAPVGCAANERNCDGSTPSTAVAAPLTGIRNASMRSACTMPGSLPTAATSPPGSENGATTSRSGWTLRRNGATGARRAAVGWTAGTGEPDRSRAPAPTVSGTPAMTAAPPVDGRTAGSPSCGEPGGTAESCGGPLSTATRTAGHGAQGSKHGEAGQAVPAGGRHR